MNSTIFNLISFGVNALAGLGLNFLILKYYSAEELGIFNISFAVYIFLSQLSVFGLHSSILKYGSDHFSEHNTLKAVLSNGAVLALFWTILSLTITYFFSDLFLNFYDSDKSEISFLLVLPGVLFFVLNKLLLNFINSQRKLNFLALFSGLRGVLMMTSFCFFLFLNFSGEMISAIFLVSEGLLFCLMFFYLIRFWSLKELSLKWIKTHFDFGRQAFLSTFLMDVSSKTDVLVLGLLVSDKLVGMYSFVAMFMEGYNQIPMVFRSITNPQINRIYRTNKLRLLEKYLRNMIKGSYRLFIPFGIVCIAAFPIPTLISSEIELYNVWPLFAILMLGPICYSGYNGVNMMFNQTGMPKVQSRFSSFIFLWNLTFNFILIPFIGVYGAAIATLTSFLFRTYLIKYLAHKKLEVSI